MPLFVKRSKSSLNEPESDLGRRKNQMWPFSGPRWIRIGTTLKVIDISLLYSPWGPFPDRFVERTTICHPVVRRTRLGAVPTGSTTVKRISLDQPFLFRPMFHFFLFFFGIILVVANFARLEFYSPVCRACTPNNKYWAATACR